MGRMKESREWAASLRRRAEMLDGDMVDGSKVAGRGWGGER